MNHKSVALRVLTFSAVPMLLSIACSSTPNELEPDLELDAAIAHDAAQKGDSSPALDGSKINPTADASEADSSEVDSSVADSSVVDASVIDASVADAHALDASVLDASDAAASDAAASDAGADGGVCAPASVAGFVPVWKAPTAFHQNVCTAPQIANFYTYCLGPSSNTSDCNAYVTANPTCESCLISDESAANYGPVVLMANVTELNIPGCIANSNAADVACAQNEQASFQCDDAACSSCASSQVINCETTVEAGGCAPYVSAASCVNSITNLDAAYNCFSGGTFLADYTAIATSFCGQ